MHNSSTYSIVTSFLQQLGFSKEETKLYTILVKKGPMTLLEAARSTNIERTSLYRITENLIKSKLIEEVPVYKRKTIKACDISTIELLVKEKEIQTQFLSQSLPTLKDTLKTITKPSRDSNVIYYRGTEGIRQMTWNILKCKGLFRTYSYRFWDEILGTSFVLKLNEEMLARNFKVHDLYSDGYIEFKKEWIRSGKNKPKGDWHFWDSRYLPEKVVTINQNIDVYNNVLAYYYWQDDEIFGVEIYNERVANLQKQIHDVLWKMSKKLPSFDWKKDWKD